MSVPGDRRRPGHRRVPRDCASLAGALPDARLELLPESGHFTMIDQPARVGALVTEFCARLPHPAGRPVTARGAADDDAGNAATRPVRKWSAAAVRGIQHLHLDRLQARDVPRRGGGAGPSAAERRSARARCTRRTASAWRSSTATPGSAPRCTSTTWSAPRWCSGPPADDGVARASGRPAYALRSDGPVSRGHRHGAGPGPPTRSTARQTAPGRPGATARPGRRRRCRRDWPELVSRHQRHRLALADPVLLLPLLRAHAALRLPAAHGGGRRPLPGRPGHLHPHAC